MDRRDFLKTCGAGAMATSGLTAAIDSQAACGADGKRSIDPDKLEETAYRHFIPGKLTCCESILLAGCEALGIESDLVPDISLGLGGGVGFQGDTCGVLTSTAMVVSLAVASKEKNYAKKKMQAVQAAGRIYCAFKEQFGAADCRSLCGLDLTTLEGRKKLAETVKAQRCAELVRTGAQLLAKELQGI